MRVRSLIERLVVLLLTVFLAFALGEMVVRMTGVQGDQLFEPDPDLGWRHRRDFRGLYVSPEARNAVAFNARGLVGPDVPDDNPPGEKRLLLLGDSFTESLQVPYADTWGVLTAEGLGDEWRAVNAGVSGYGTDNALWMWREEGRTLNPDVVLLLVFPGNDVSDNDPELYALTGDGLPKPHVSVSGGSLSVSPAAETIGEGSSLKSLLRNRSRLYLFLRDTWKRFRARSQHEAEGGLPVHWGVYRTSWSPAFERGWRTTQVLLRTLADEVEASGARFVVGLIPTGWRIEPDQRRALAEAHAELETDATWDPAAPDRRLEAFLGELGIPVVDLFPALDHARKVVDEPLYGDHLTPRGHRVVADTLVAFLRNVMGAPN